jgi:fructose-bisphosphate aldolase, class I
MDVCGYAAHIAAELGAHIIKVKLPTAHLEQEAARKVYEKEKVPIATLTERVKHVVQCTFNGRRIVIFSGGPAGSDETVYQEVTAIRDGGGFGSIIGRNSFQRKKEQALQFLGKIISIYGQLTDLTLFAPERDRERGTFSPCVPFGEEGDGTVAAMNKPWKRGRYAT